MTIDQTVSLLLGAVIPLIIGSAYAIVSRAVKRRVMIQSPEARAIAQIIPAINILIDTQGPIIEALSAVLECQKGICNGNVDAALAKTRGAHGRYQQFLSNSARVEVIK